MIRIKVKGSAGSGDWGHRGRIGKRGGSAKGSPVQLVLGAERRVSKLSKVKSSHTVATDEYKKGAQPSYLATLPDGTKVIVKVGSRSADREVAAYEISKMMGYTGLVPPTRHTTSVIESQNINRRTSMPIDSPASEQEWVEGMELPYMSKPAALDAESYIQMTMLDAVIGNTDRNNSNWLYDKVSGRVTAIDNESSLGSTFVDAMSIMDGSKRAWKSLTDSRMPLKARHFDAARKLNSNASFWDMVRDVSKSTYTVDRAKSRMSQLLSMQDDLREFEELLALQG